MTGRVSMALILLALAAGVAACGSMAPAGEYSMASRYDVSSRSMHGR